MCARVGSVNGPLKWPLAEGEHCVNVTDRLLQVRLALTALLTLGCITQHRDKMGCSLQVLWVFVENT